MALPDALVRAAFEQSSGPCAVAEGSGLLALWNEAFASLFTSIAGAGPERLGGSLFDFLASRECARFDYFAAEVLMGARKAATFESPVRAADGSSRTLRFSLSLLEVPAAQAPVGGERARYLHFAIEDVSERVARERRLRDAKEEAEKATHTKSQFLANMSHEIRTPIQTILGVVELLQETSLDGEQSDYTGQVRFSAEVLLGLINDILDFSKIEAGKFDLETASFDLRDAVRQSVDMLILDAHRKGLEIVVDVDPSLPSLVRGDSGRIRQIIVNLFKNAVKFTHEGSISLCVRPADRSSGSRVRFEVADTGAGVPEAVRDKLFTPFFQADLAQARKTGGTGLGLAISRHLVELMGGNIGLSPGRSDYQTGEPGLGGPGSTFWFEIPLVAPEYSSPPRSAFASAASRFEAALEAGARSAVGAGAAGAVGFGPSAKLLVVDDHPAARSFAVRTAAAAGYDVSAAASGEEALAVLRQAAAGANPFAICLIDQNMPKMDGWRLASEITGDTAINGARLILMAPVGAIGADAKMKLLRWFNGYISKPIDPPQLLEALARASSAEVDLEPAEGGLTLADEEESELFNCELLLAEDHEVNRELFTILLQRLGCRVVTARDGAEAAEIGASHPFDLVLMDIFMPRMNGYEATKALRDSGYHGPIVAVTASALKGEREKCIGAGMNDILVKPFKKRDLARILNVWGPEARAKAGSSSATKGAGGGTKGSAVSEAPADSRGETADSSAQPKLRPPRGSSRATPRAAPRGSSRRAAASADAGLAAGARAKGTDAETAANAPVKPKLSGPAEPPVPDAAIFDWVGVLDTFLGQRETVVSLLGRFIAKATEQETELRTALADRDLSRFGKIAHSLKGASWNLSARHLGDAALAAETAGREEDLDAAREAATKVKAALAEFAAAAQPYAMGDAH